MDTRPFEQGASKATSTINDISTFAAAKFAAVQAVVSRAVDTAATLMQAGLQKAVAGLKEAAARAEGLNAVSKNFEAIYKSSSQAEGALRGVAKITELLNTSSQSGTGIAKQLAEAGVKANQLVLAVGVLSNISAGSGQSLESLGKTYADVYKRGFLSTSELNAMTAAGIPLQQQLARQMHESFGSVESMASKGKISAADFFKALQNMGTNTGNNSGMMSIYAGASAAALDTFEGRINKIRSTLSDMAVAIIRPFMGAGEAIDKATTPLAKIKEALKPVAEIVLSTVQALQPSIDSMANRFRVLLAGLAGGVSMADEIAGRLKTGVGSLEFLQKLPGYAAEFGKGLANAVDFLATAFQQGTLWEIAGLKLRIAFDSATEALSARVSAAMSGARETLKAAVGYAMDFLTDPGQFQRLGASLLAVFDTAASFLSSAMESAANKLKAIFQNSIIPAITGGLQYAIQEAAAAIRAKMPWVAEKMGIGGGAQITLDGAIGANTPRSTPTAEGPSLRDSLKELRSKISEFSAGSAAKLVDALGKIGNGGGGGALQGPSSSEFELNKRMSAVRSGIADTQQMDSPMVNARALNTGGTGKTPWALGVDSAVKLLPGKNRQQSADIASEKAVKQLQETNTLLTKILNKGGGWKSESAEEGM